jgi:hypothetical protein
MAGEIPTAGPIGRGYHVVPPPAEIPDKKEQAMNAPFSISSRFTRWSRYSATITNTMPPIERVPP